MLLKHPNILVNLVNGSFCTPLWIAANEGHLEVMKVLMADKRVNSNERNATGATPLFRACLSSPEAALMLIRWPGVNVNKPTFSKMTPLYISCERGEDEVVEALLQHPKIDVNLSEEDFGCTPVFLAAQNGHLKIIKLFLIFAKGVDLLKKPKIDFDEDRRDASDQALHNGHDEIHHLLTHFKSYPQEMKSLMRFDLQQKLGFSSNSSLSFFPLPLPFFFYSFPSQQNF